MILFVRKVHRSTNLIHTILALVGVFICLSWLYVTNEYAIFGLVILLIYVGVIAIMFALFNYLFSIPKESLTKVSIKAN